MRFRSLISLGLFHSTHVESFTVFRHVVFRFPTGNKPSSSSSSSLAVTPASIVSVCTAELCCCQEDGVGGLEILADLQARNLPYRIDEAPCLGACGGGAMVAIDFEDGSSTLVTGLEETLMELGLSKTLNHPVATPASNTGTSTTTENSTPVEDMTEEKKSLVESSKEENEVPAAFPIAETKKSKINSSTSNLVDVRERMRAEATKDEKPANPWFNAATYLAGKAAEKLFGEK